MKWIRYQGISCWYLSTQNIHVPIMTISSSKPITNNSTQSGQDPQPCLKTSRRALRITRKITLLQPILCSIKLKLRSLSIIFWLGLTPPLNDMCSEPFVFSLQPRGFLYKHKAELQLAPFLRSKKGARKFWGQYIFRLSTKQHKS